MKTALVLSAGGMFGAYQAGAWSVLADAFEPDLIVGASIGAINGWAIAGGCPPAQLVERWLDMGCASSYRWHLPIRGGVLDSRALVAKIEEVYSAYHRRLDYALTVTESYTLRPRIFRNDEVTPAILRASTAIPIVFDQVRIGRRLYCDGGLINALPVWAAAELGAERIVAVNSMIRLPGWLPNLFVDAMRWLSPFRAPAQTAAEIILIAPEGPLGEGLDMLYWDRSKAERLIEMGRAAARAVLPTLAAKNRFHPTPALHPT